MGISSHENDYRLSWALNKSIDLNLKKIANHNIVDNKYPEPLIFSRFSYEDEDSLLLYTLLSNRCEDGFLIGEIKNIDYFLIIHGEINKNFISGILKKINKLSLVNTAFQIDPNDIKSRQKLLI